MEDTENFKEHTMGRSIIVPQQALPEWADLFDFVNEQRLHEWIEQDLLPS